MAIGIGLGLPFRHKRRGIDWSAYWTTLISATVENAAPTHVVLTFPTAQASLVASDFTVTVNGVARTVNSSSWGGAVLTLVLASAVEYIDVVVVTFTKTGGTANVTNNVLTYTALLTSVGAGNGVATLKMRVSANISITLGANAKFYTDAGGTLGETDTWNITSGAMRTIYLKCTTGTATFTISDTSKVTHWGSAQGSGWSGTGDYPRLSLAINKYNNLQELRISGTSTLTGEIVSTVQYIYATSGVTWNVGTTIPSGLNTLLLADPNITWNYSGALPSGLTFVYFNGNNLTWTYSGALPTGLGYIYIAGNLINWTGLDIGNNGNIGTLVLQNYRDSKMSSADMVTLLTQMTNRTGNLPATITINDYADYASPPAEVVAAVAALKAAKSITTVNLGA